MTHCTDYANIRYTYTVFKECIRLIFGISSIDMPSLCIHVFFFCRNITSDKIDSRITSDNLQNYK